MSFYMCFDWFKKLRLFSYVLESENRRRSQGVACRCHLFFRRFSLNEAPLGLFKFISDYLPYFEKNKYIFQYHNKKV
jgi:hypothetical protein